MKVRMVQGDFKYFAGKDEDLFDVPASSTCATEFFGYAASGQIVADNAFPAQTGHGLIQ